METKKSDSLLKLVDYGYSVVPLKLIRIGDKFQTREDGAVYILSHYVQSSKKFCYYRKDDINRYYYANGDKLVILV